MTIPDVDGSDEGPTNISMDYMYLGETNKEDRDTPTNPPHLVIVDHRHGRIWAHRVPHKGSFGQAEWVPRRILPDLANNGMQSMKIHVKTDQEPAMVNIQIALQDLNPDRVIPINSTVGGSECNGRIGNAIRRVQEKVRALRHHIEHNIKYKIPDDAPVMSWLVRWAVELLSKYVVGDDGKTPYERVHKEDCITFLVPFGETVMYLPLKTVHQNKGTPAKRAGVWLGVSERIEEVLIGTRNGVIKCRIVSRFAETDRWNRENVLKMVWTFYEPILGRPSQHIPVDVIDDGGFMEFDSENEEFPKEIIDDEADDQEFKVGIDKFHVSRKAIKEFGEIVGCPACGLFKTRGNQPGRIGNITQKHVEDECWR